VADQIPASVTHVPTLPQRYVDLKTSLLCNELIQSWRLQLLRLRLVAQRSSHACSMRTFINGLDEKQTNEIKCTGCVIVKGGVPKEEALSWKQRLLKFIAVNREHIEDLGRRGRILRDLCKLQLAARQHPAIINTRRALLY